MRISGTPILPIAAQVAGDEPQSAAKIAQAPRFEASSPPGTRYSQRSSASYRSAPARELAIAPPIRMNIGIDRSAKLSSDAVEDVGHEAERVDPVGPDQKAHRDDAEGERDGCAGQQHGDGDRGDQQTELQLAHGGSAPPPNGAWRPVTSARISATYCSDSRPMPRGTAK